MRRRRGVTCFLSSVTLTPHSSALIAVTETPREHIKGRDYFFGSKVLSIILGFVVSGPMARQSILGMGAYGRGVLPHLLTDKKQRERVEGAGARYSPKNSIPSDLLSLTCPGLPELLELP